MNKVHNLGGFWRPSESDNIYQMPKRKKQRPQKKRKPKFDYPKAHEFLIRFYNLHKYTSYAALAFVICEKTGKDTVLQKSQYKKVIRKEYNRLNNKQLRPTYQTKTDDEFYKSQAWKEVRYIVLQKHSGACMLCGARASDGVHIHVDHIVPRSIDRNKELDINNLQVLCSDCNLGKSNFDDTNWKKHWEEI